MYHYIIDGFLFLFPQVVSKPDKLWFNDGDYICNEIIKNNDGHADFTYKCCTRNENHGFIQCTEDSYNMWIEGLYTLIALMKIGFLLFGPWLLQWCVYQESISKVDYVIRLKEPLNKTMLVKKLRVYDERLTSSISQQREMKQFKKFRKLVKHIPSDEIVPVTFKKLHIQVDHKELISEKSVPVGLIHFLWNKFFLCGIRKHQPFLSCCQESIFGSWSPKFLWFPLMKKFYCNMSWRQYVSWGHMFNLLGGLVVMAAIPIPYYIRVVIYYYVTIPQPFQNAYFIMGTCLFYLQPPLPLPRTS